MHESQAVRVGDELFHDDWLATAPEARGAWSRFKTRFRLPKLRVIERQIRKFITHQHDAGPIALHEHGCGGGFNLATLGSLLSDVRPRLHLSGTDIAPRAIAFAQARYTNINFMIDDAQASELPDRAFDVMISADLLGHLPKLEIAIHHVARCIRPGGWYITFTETDGYRRDIGSWREPICRLAGVDPWIEKDLHVNLRPAAEIAAIFQQVGFRTIFAHGNLDGGKLVARLGGKDVRAMVAMSALTPDPYLEACMRAEIMVERLGIKGAVTWAHMMTKFLTSDSGRYDRGGYYFVFQREV